MIDRPAFRSSRRTLAIALVFLGVFLGCGSLGPNSASAAAPPVAAYSFDEGEGETVEDLTGNEHTATIEGADWSTRGRYGGAMQFDREAHDFLKVPAAEDLDGSEELTVEAWVRPTETSYLGEIVMKEREGSGPDYSWTLDQQGSEAKEAAGYFMQTEEGMVASGEGALPLATWTHVALTDDGAHNRLYVNGELVDTAPAIAFDGHGDIRIGGNAVFGQWFDGRIDELRIYDRALAAGEISADRDTPLANSNLVHARIYTGDPSEEGEEIAQEWANLGTEAARRETATEVSSQQIGPCPEAPEMECVVQRRRMLGGEEEEPENVNAVPVIRKRRVGSVATILIPRSSDYETVASGASSSILQPWQAPPPGSGETYKLLEVPPAEESEFAWRFWVDSRTRLPLKAELAFGGEPEVTYYSYDPRSSAPGPLFGKSEPQSKHCAANATIGGWQLNRAAAVYPDPRMPSLVKDSDAPVMLKPLGAAEDGPAERTHLASHGVELEAGNEARERIEWEVSAGSELSLLRDRDRVKILDEDKDVIAIVSSTNGEPDVRQVSTGDANATQTVVVAHPGGEVITVEPAKLSSSRACFAIGADEAAKAATDFTDRRLQAFDAETQRSGETAQIAVRLNPSAAGAGVKVFVSGPCTDHSKFVGEDGKALFGGCEVGAIYQVRVPQTIQYEGRNLVEPRNTRRFSLPASGHSVIFRFRFNGGANGLPEEEEKTGGIFEIPESEEEPEVGVGEASASGISLLPEAFRAGMLKQFKEFKACASGGTIPQVIGVKGKPYAAVEWWVSCQKTKYLYIEFKARVEEAPLLVKRDEEWVPRDALGDGLGVEVLPEITQYPLGSGPHFLIAPCRDVSSRRYWRNHASMQAFSVAIPEGIFIVRDKSFPAIKLPCS